MLWNSTWREEGPIEEREKEHESRTDVRVDALIDVSTRQVSLCERCALGL